MPNSRPRIVYNSGNLQKSDVAYTTLRGGTIQSKAPITDFYLLLTGASPVVAKMQTAYDDTLYVFGIGRDNNLWYTRTDGVTWDASPTPIKSNGSTLKVSQTPTVTCIANSSNQNNTALGYTYLFYNDSTDSTVKGALSYIKGTVKYVKINSISESADERVQTGDTSKLGDDIAWDTPVTSNYSILGNPSIISISSLLGTSSVYIFFKAPDNNLYYIMLRPDGKLTQPRMIIIPYNVQLIGSPYAHIHNGRVEVFFQNANSPGGLFYIRSEPISFQFLNWNFQEEADYIIYETTGILRWDAGLYIVRNAEKASITGRPCAVSYSDGDSSYYLLFYPVGSSLWCSVCVTTNDDGQYGDWNQAEPLEGASAISGEPSCVIF